jgi:hypothetical protein
MPATEVAGRISAVFPSVLRRHLNPAWIGLAAIVIAATMAGVFLLRTARRGEDLNDSSTRTAATTHDAGATYRSEDAATRADSIPLVAPIRAPPAVTPAQVSRLTVQVRGLPAMATVKVDGRPTAIPLQLDGDDATHHLEVESPGYLPSRLVFRATADLTFLDVKMTEVPRPLPPVTRPRAEPMTSSPPPRVNPRKDMSGAWEPPY